MKCKKCGQKASVNMRQHKLALCKEHYLEWVPEQTERFIKKYEMFSHDDKSPGGGIGRQGFAVVMGYPGPARLSGGWSLYRARHR